MSNWWQTDGRLCWSAVLAVAAFCLLARTGGSAESKPETNVVPLVPLASGKVALGAFHVKAGFRLQLVAAEPLVTAPVAMAFDENGRLFVVERPDSPDLRGTNAPRGRIRLLEDTEGEGEFHTSTIYADNLPWASALACYGGGVLVAAGHDLIYLKDTRTNGIADLRQVVFSGIGGTNMLDALALPNNFNWGLDNRIHAASGGVTGLVPESTGAGAALVPLTSADFSLDPREITICAETGPAQSGLSFDNWGRKFTCDFRRPLRMQRYELRYGARNRFFPPPPPMLEVASPATEIWGLASVELPPLAAARPGKSNEPAQALTRSMTALKAGWLTNAQGCAVYRGNTFPTNYFGDAFVADPSAHLIHRLVLRGTGLNVTAFRAPDETNTEFVASPDSSFRPVQIVNGPDGALYIVDHQDNSERGRIYRVAPPGFKPAKPPRLGHAKTYDLVATLSHSNGWQRDTAARLLFERRDLNAVPLLTSVLDQSRLPLARLHALYVLDGLGALNSAHVATGLRDADERIREHAVRLSEKLVRGGALQPVVWDQLLRMADDPSVRVRYQFAFTVGDLHRSDSAEPLAAILRRAGADPWMEAAVFSSLAEGAGDLFVTLARDPRVRGDLVGQERLRRLAAMIGVKGQSAEVAKVVGFMDEIRSEPQTAFALLYALGDGLHRARSSLVSSTPEARSRPFFDQALSIAMNPALPEPFRVGGIQLLGVGPFTFANTGDLLLLLLGSGQSENIQAAALATLGRFDDPRIAPALIQRWRALNPRLRREAVTAVLARTDGVAAVLTALESGMVGSAELSSAQVNFLRTCRDPGISRRAVQFFGPVPRQRPSAMQRFKPALGLKGAPTRGRDIYLARCAVCHQPSGATPAMGPEPASVRTYGREKVLTEILEPNADVRRDYLAYAVETGQGESLVGLLRDENPTTITVQRLKGGPVVLPRANIQYLQAQSWSFMPEGLEEGLSLQDVADLLAYILGPKATP